jgi:hypothetical protein
MVQLFPAKRFCAHVVVILKSPGFAPTTTNGLKVMVVVPTSVRVTDCGLLVVPTFWVPKSSFGGASLTLVPVPASVTICGLVGSLSLIETVALLGPPTSGLKVTVMVQLAPGPSVAVHVVVLVKSPI